jgi:hypothetical protein
MRCSAIVLGLLCLLLSSCGTSAPATPARPAPVPATPIAPIVKPPDPNADAIKHDQELEAAAKKAGDDVALYKAQAQEARDQHASALDAANSWQKIANLRTRSATLAATARENAILVTEAHWVAGILFGASLIGVVVAIWLPLARKWAVNLSIACFGGAVLAMLFAVVVPYLIWIGLGIVLIGVAYGIVQWHKTHTALTRVVQAGENVKTAFPELASKITPILASTVNESSPLVDTIRTKLASQLEAQVKALAKKL